MSFDLALSAISPLRLAIDRSYRRAEPECVAELAALAAVDQEFRRRVSEDATRLVQSVRHKRARAGGVDALMREFSLSSEEGVALMCLAEALLRIPDSATRDALIRDKVGGADWHAHIGRSPSLFVNAASWGLLITGTLVATHSSSGLSRALARLVGKGGEPLIRKGVDLAMRMLGRQFVTGETIGAAIDNGAPFRARGYRYSYDMLGEGAVTAEDAKRYFRAYEDAIHAIGRHAASLDLPRADAVRLGPGISVKLSALHPRYTRLQRSRVMHELYPRLRSLTVLARSYAIGLNIDAEESERLDLSLDLLTLLAQDPELTGWSGLGFVVQAYQKRAPAVLDFIIDLARRSQDSSGRRLMVRLVKGAYWDSEIKRAQVDGQVDYPVYTRKVHTDVSYQACAQKLLAATDAIYPQFATHNAYTVAWIRQAARQSGVGEAGFEFQCLHGMGETLYDQVVGQPDAQLLACRIYAPVGSHETLLAYLVRRLLENGANSSFVNRIVDENVSVATLVEDPVIGVTGSAGTNGAPHARIPLPGALYPHQRINSAGCDWSSESVLHEMAAALAPFASARWEAAPTFHVEDVPRSPDSARPIRNPARHADVVGQMRSATSEDVDGAVAIACSAAIAWADVTGGQRARLLHACARALEENRVELVALTVREAGKTLPNAIGEVREAVDFLRYYAAQLEAQPDAVVCAEAPLVCISPWNFPLAIFVGQIAAALAAGRVVLAKPAEQTPLIAARAVALMHAAGIAREVLQLLPGDGSVVGARLTVHSAIGGVLFTGSTAVARGIARALATAPGERLLVAETGGQNAMLVDSSALTEQVVADIVGSAFDSAGQRCSALRVLCIQEEVAAVTLQMIAGALAELNVGDPASLACDVGPVIDREAQERLETYVAQMAARGHRITRTAVPATCDAGTFVAPTLIEINHLSELPGEVFGPVLHVLRYRFGTLDALVEDINATGYGLTMGVHSRIDEHIQTVVARSHVGNLYINRNMVGAVVGVQPFGGEGLSGTGPKAGGPLYLARLGGPIGRELDPGVSEASDEGGSEGAAGTAASTVHSMASNPILAAWRAQIKAEPALTAPERERVLASVQAAARASLRDRRCLLPGPTGETNMLWFSPREAVVCVAPTRLALLQQMGLVLACGGTPVGSAELLPEGLVQWLTPLDATTLFEAVLVAGEPEEISRWRARVAALEGPIVPVIVWPSTVPGTTSETTALQPIAARLFHERTVTTNTAAAGGNASLMTLAD